MRQIGPLMALCVLGACGGDKALTYSCTEAQLYQSAVDGKRIVVPEGLSPLNEYDEMQIPRAAPDAAKPPPGACVESPPAVNTGS
jgi:uncharacterized lipoprotein